MDRIQNRRQIFNRKEVVAALKPLSNGPQAAAPHERGEVLKVIKDALAHGREEIRRRLEADEIDGNMAVRSQSFLIDQVIRTLSDFSVTGGLPVQLRANSLAIAATGGYGRGELAPFSDVDLLFLVRSTADRAAEALVEYLLYMLWDCGLKVGHATRTLDDCVSLARKDLTIRTCMLESRYLWGDETLFAAFENRFFSEVVEGTGRQFVEDKLRERDSRHERTGDSRYVLEPHIKEGKGGLRDLQTLFWLAKYLYRVRDMADLVERGVFTQSDLRLFRKAQDFLWRVRCHLHYVAGRPEDRLTFNVQEAVADRLGYTSRASARGVERFMKHYFHVTKTVGDLTRVLCAVLEHEQAQARLRFRLPSLTFLRRLAPGFVLDSGRLNIDSVDAFEKDPVRMLRLFHEAQRLGRDIHPKAMRLAQQSLSLITPAVRQDAEANRLFMDILTAPTDPEPTLRRLNEAGIFGRFIPDFGRVVAQMQYDMYHHFTVDEHSIRAIGILGRLERGELAADHPTASRIITEVRSRRALYLSVLLHDIAKGRNGDHSVLGAEVALRLAPRLGLDEWETETVSWLVRYHLLMARTAFKRDIDDPATVATFVSLVQSPEWLRLLLILTNVDIRAVGPGVWNSWKEGLLSELYFRALEDMEITSDQPRQRRGNRVEAAKQRLRDRLVGWDEETLEAYIQRGYPDYWLAFDTNEHVRHFGLMADAEASGGILKVQAVFDPVREAVQVTVYAPDHAGLFAQIAGGIALASASIVDAKIVTLANSMALDVLHVQSINGPFDGDEARLGRLVRRIEDAISGRLHLGRALEAAHRSPFIGRARAFKVPPRVIFDNAASNAYTVIELNGRDRPGFLYDVTSTLTGLGLQIGSAHISTYGPRVVDVFYVKDAFGLKVDQPAKLARIEELLMGAMAGVKPGEPARDETASESVPALT